MLAASDPRVRRRVLERYRLGLKTGAPVGAGSFTKHVVMLVAEQTSHPEANKYHAPFCSLKACSGWLNALLEEAEIPEHRLFWVNALDNDGSEVALDDLYRAIEPIQVLALGNVARDQLKKRQVPYMHLPHPQYWKRFRHHQPYPLIEQLLNLTCYAD